MQQSTVQLLATLLAAHFLGDFILQTAEDALNKRRPLVLLKHSAIHAGLAYLLAGQWQCWLIPVCTAISHAAIDYAKTWSRDTAVSFVVDQTTHIGAIVAAVLFIEHYPHIVNAAQTVWWWPFGSAYAAVMVHVAGLIAAVNAGSFLLARFVAPYLNELQTKRNSDDQASPRSPRGLTNAGSVIGKLERLLVFVLVLAGQPGGIAFLIAAKSIFRFGELKEAENRMESEYIIIGTLASFAYGIAVSYATAGLPKLV